MPETSYPEFVAGQTLTSAELNDLRLHLHHRDRLVGRMVGFGVNCGLGGTVSGSTLTIAPGLALDQVGEPLLLPASRTISLPPAAAGPQSPAFDFVATDPGGFSVVAEVGDTVEDAPDCGQGGCVGHAKVHTRLVELRVVPGRVTTPRFDFAQDPLLSVEPMRLSLDSAPVGSYSALRDAIATRLTNGTAPLVNPALITALQGTSIATADIAGVKGYKAGWINMVLFATLDLLRCRALAAVACDRSTARPGVVLGWLHLVGSAWTWDCGYRHAWEPPQGFTQSLLGGTCSDPCSIARDRLEAILAGFAPPPPPSSGGGGGGGVVVPDDIVFCPSGFIRVGGRCVNVYYPPVEIPDDWVIPWVEDPLGPIWNPPDRFLADDPWDIYGTDRWNFYGDGVISGIEVLGRDGQSALDALSDVVSGHGVTPSITLAGADEVQGIDGYMPSGGFSPSDTIVLTVDALGSVVATGRVPAVHTGRQMGTALPAAVGAARDAQAAADGVRGLAEGLSTQVEGFSTQLATFGTDLQDIRTDLGGIHQELVTLGEFRTDTGDWRGQLDTTLAGLDARIQTGVRDLVGDRLAQLEGSVRVLESAGTVPGRGTPGVDREYARGLAEFARTTIEAMRSLPNAANREFTRLTADAQRAAERYEQVLAGDDLREVQTASIELLDTIRTVVKSSGADPALGSRLDQQFGAIRGIIR